MFKINKIKDSIASLDVYISDIEESIKSYMSKYNVPLQIKEIIYYHFAWDNQKERRLFCKGKYLRSLIIILVYRMRYNDYSEVLPLACAVELIHNCSLILDDLIDQHNLRRERKTVYKNWSSSEAIHVAFELMIIANKILEEKIDNEPQNKNWIKVKIGLNDVCKIMNEGNFKEFLIQPSKNNIETYNEIVEKKTASLFEYSAVCAALIKGRKTIIANLRKFGKYIGMAHQIRDDLNEIFILLNNRNFELRQEKLIKKELLKTLPFIITYNNLESKNREIFYSEIINDTQDIENILNVIKRFKGLEKAEEICQNYYKKAVLQLNCLEHFNVNRENIKILAKYIAFGEY